MQNDTKAEARPWMGIMFDCCNVYTRVYRDREGKHYVGRCPKCCRSIKFMVGDGGSGSRFWRVK